MQFPGYVREIIKKLESAGFSAYAVGGCVRDSLSGRTPADWDITTAALPDTVKAIFSEAPFSVLTGNGLRHGTVTVRLGEHFAEVTTYRTEGAYTDHRHPDAVSFVSSLTEDLARRDFTVNAMAARPLLGGEVEIVDPFSGKADLAADVLRAVGDGERRFTEDALRILRGMRFAARFGFTVEADTASAMHRCAPLLLHIAPERIGTELSGILAAPFAPRLFREFSDILDLLLPGAFVKEAALARSEDKTVRLALLLSRIPPETAKEHLGRYALGTAMAERVARFLSLRDAPLTDHAHRCRLADRLGEADSPLYFAFRFALSPDDPSVPAAQKALSDLFSSGACYNVATLSITGADLLAVGVKKGPRIGEILSSLTTAVIKGEIENDRTALLSAARSM